MEVLIRVAWEVEDLVGIQVLVLMPQRGLQTLVAAEVEGIPLVAAQVALAL
jgi:hypothetical protein